MERDCPNLHYADHIQHCGHTATEHNEVGCGNVQASDVCQHPLATRPILYTDTVGGKQTLRDDLWAVSTEELNSLLND